MQQIRCVEFGYLEKTNSLLAEGWNVISITPCNENGGAYIVLERKMHCRAKIKEDKK